MPLTLVSFRDEDGEDVSCPRFVCDECGTPIDARSGWLRGIVLWHLEYPNGVEVIGPIYYVHQGECDARFSHTRGGINHFWSRELSEYLAQLVHNTTSGEPTS